LKDDEVAVKDDIENNVNNQIDNHEYIKVEKKENNLEMNNIDPPEEENSAERNKVEIN
jgi:hypothetical protein